MAKGYVKWNARDKTWIYHVVAQGKIVFSDDTRDWQKVFNLCYRDVVAARRVVSSGHTFERSWYEIVDAAAEVL